MAYVPAAGDRVVIHRTNTRNGKSDVMTGVILDAGDSDSRQPIYFAWDFMGRFHLAASAELAELGCTQTIELVKAAANEDD